VIGREFGLLTQPGMTIVCVDSALPLLTTGGHWEWIALWAIADYDRGCEIWFGDAAYDALCSLRLKMRYTVKIGDSWTMGCNVKRYYLISFICRKITWRRDATGYFCRICMESSIKVVSWKARA